MAVNYSHRPVFPAHVSEDNFVSPLRIVNGCLVEGVPERNGEGYTRPWNGNLGEADEWNFRYGRDRADCCSSSESTSDDIVDRLPSDPFGMDVNTTFTAITGWLENLEADSRGYMGSNNGWSNQEGFGLFAGWNLIWNNSLKFQQFPSNVQSDEKLNKGVESFPSNLQVYEKQHMVPSNVQYDEKINVGSTVNKNGGETGIGGVPASTMGDFGGFSNGSSTNFGGKVGSSELEFGGKVEDAANFEGVPNEALAFALRYLGVKDLLSVERVCKFLCSTVRGDPLLWASIHINQPLNERITDDSLVQLASRAQGNLRCLSLMGCLKVTDDGLRHILEANPRITKLFVPGCTKINIEYIVNSVKAYNSNKDAGGIKQLRIGGLKGVKHEHVEELRLLLGAGDGNELEGCHKPHFYNRDNHYFPYVDDRAIDVELCRSCDTFTLVFDCPAENCRDAGVCRGCINCIDRCVQCGSCVDDKVFEETFCMEALCSDCDPVPRQAV